MQSDMALVPGEADTIGSAFLLLEQKERTKLLDNTISDYSCEDRVRTFEDMLQREPP